MLAQDRTTKILVGFPPGGSADIVARLLADKMRATLGQNVLVDNKPGAAGRVALGEVKRAAPGWPDPGAGAERRARGVAAGCTRNLGFDPVPATSRRSGACGGRSISRSPRGPAHPQR